MADLSIKYVPVVEARLFDRNAKKHDLEKIKASIARHGFRNPPIWDNTLNSGQGGIAAGNGRTEALHLMELAGAEVPNGIAVDKKGRWCLPIVFGCDASSEIEAMAFAIDDNNLTMAGGGFSDADIAKLWDEDAYTELLRTIADENVLPVSVDEDAIADLLLSSEGDGGPVSEEGGAVGDPPYENKFGILIEAADAAHQESLYNDLSSQGYKCRVLTV